MKQYNLALLGFGNVSRALAGLLKLKTQELREHYGVEWRLTGVASRRIGWQANPAGFDVDQLMAGNFDAPVTADSYPQWLQAAQPAILFENTSLDPETGQPALDYLKAALNAGIHVITANKGPLVHGYHELRALAESKHRRFLFEATVMGGAPIFSLFREALPGVSLKRFRGLLNSTTNLILTEMEEGLSYEKAVKKAQDLGIAETDPSADVDGWDAAVKVSALATVLMDVPLKPQAIEREGIRGLSQAQVQAARRDGQPYKLVCVAERTATGVSASVRPQQLPLNDPLAQTRGANSIITFEMDMLHGLTLSEQNPDAVTTAYGPLADFIAITQGD